jgi:hypothetical protein
MRKRWIRDAVLALAVMIPAHSADAHGIAGNRFFVGTLTFDDPRLPTAEFFDPQSLRRRRERRRQSVRLVVYPAANAGSAG